VLGFERNRFQDQKVEGPLDQIVCAHAMIIYNRNCRLPLYANLANALFVRIYPELLIPRLGT